MLTTIFVSVLLLSLILILFLYLLFCPFRWLNLKKMYDLDKAVPGDSGFPLLGHSYDMIHLQHEDLLNWIEYRCSLHPRFTKIWMTGLPFVVLKDPVDLEVAMSSMLHINKGLEYNTLLPWLNEGLLVSSGDKWRNRRKILTPSFHFKILEDNITSINKHSRSMVRNVLNTNGNEFEVNKLINLCTLDIICETAMGINIDSQNNKGKDYVEAIKIVGECTVERVLRFWLNRTIVFNLSTLAKPYYSSLDTLHKFTEKVIKERKQSYLKDRTDLAEKKRKAFLDSMIEMECRNPGSLTDSDIREEVDTFMFEGHDTTSAALNFAIYELGKNEEIQEKAYEEQFEIFGDSDRDVDWNDLAKMVYLEKVIKETLRLYPSVPYISRSLSHDLKLRDIVIPKGVNLVIVPYILHRDPNIYPNPLVFDPERFSSGQIRHPYSYIPFSAGPRNCIGQRFAMMELKIVLSSLLRFTKLESVTRTDEFKLIASLILRPSKPLKMKATKRCV